MYPKLFNQHNFVDWYAVTPHFFDDEVMIDRCDFLKDINNAIMNIMWTDQHELMLDLQKH